ncbi:MAG TPA: YIP1 family protein [bacterium]|nr:YIP1 family protein [bacterium]
MNTKTGNNQELGVFNRMIGIFTSPRETFEDINKKPTWFVPFLILSLVIMVSSFFLMDIRIADQMAKFEAQGIPEAQLEIIQDRMAGPFKYIQLIFIPVSTLIIWCIITGLYLFTTNIVFSGETNFKKMFSVMAWTSLIGVIATALKSILIYSKETGYGVLTSLAILLPTPAMTDEPSLLFKVLAHMDVFSIWSLILTIIGISAISKVDTQKSAMIVISLWIVWILISLPLWSIFGPFVVGY